MLAQKGVQNKRTDRERVIQPNQVIVVHDCKGHFSAFLLNQIHACHVCVS